MTPVATTIIYRISEVQAVAQKTRLEVVDKLLRAFEVETLPSWTLEHRLFRSADGENTAGSSPLTPDSKLQHLLQLNLGDETASDAFVIYEGSAVPSDGVAQWTMSATSRIPSSQFASYTHLMTQKMQYQWLLRAALYVSHGSAFEVSNGSFIFTVRIGELLARQHNSFRGVVVSITFRSVSAETADAPASVVGDMEIDAAQSDGEVQSTSFAVAMIDAFWQTLDLTTIKDWRRQDDGGNCMHGIAAEDVTRWQWATSLKGRT